MSLRDLLRQRRQAASVPAVPATFPPPGTEKSLSKQEGSRCPRCSRRDTSKAETASLGLTDAAPLATADEVEAMLANLRTVGHDLREMESLARTVMRNLTCAAAAEMAAVLDDLFQTAPSADVARSQCQRVLSDPQALAAAKAVWPDLACLPDDSTPALDSAPTVVVHAPRWLRYIRAHCPLVPEDETHLRRYLGSQAPDAAKQAAKRYVTTWQQAAETEPRQTARDNAGRRAANRSLWENRHAK